MLTTIFNLIHQSNNYSPLNFPQLEENSFFSWSRYEVFLDEVKPQDISLSFLREFMELPTSYFTAGGPLKYRKLAIDSHPIAMDCESLLCLIFQANRWNLCLQQRAQSGEGEHMNKWTPAPGLNRFVTLSRSDSTQ